VQNNAAYCGVIVIFTIYFVTLNWVNVYSLITILD
jgi:hypothetical protein